MLIVIYYYYPHQKREERSSSPKPSHPGLGPRTASPPLGRTHGHAPGVPSPMEKVTMMMKASEHPREAARQSHPHPQAPQQQLPPHHPLSQQHMQGQQHQQQQQQAGRGVSPLPPGLMARHVQPHHPGGPHPPREGPILNLPDNRLVSLTFSLYLYLCV